MFEFAWPWLLLALPLPWVAYRFFPARPSAQAALLVPFLNAPRMLLNQTSGAKQQAWLRRALAASALGMPGAGRRPPPMGGRHHKPAQQRAGFAHGGGHFRQYANRRHAREWHPISRIAVIKNVVGDFVARRQNDRLGLVLFGTQASLTSAFDFLIGRR